MCQIFTSHSGRVGKFSQRTKARPPSQEASTECCQITWPASRERCRGLPRILVAQASCTARTKLQRQAWEESKRFPFSARVCTSTVSLILPGEVNRIIDLYLSVGGDCEHNKKNEAFNLLRQTRACNPWLISNSSDDRFRSKFCGCGESSTVSRCCVVNVLISVHRDNQLRSRFVRQTLFEKFCAQQFRSLNNCTATSENKIATE